MPSTEDELGGLNTEQWRELRDCASRLEKTLQLGAASVDLHQFLPAPDAPHRRAVLHELIKTELEARYSRGRGCLLEEFLQRRERDPDSTSGRSNAAAGLSASWHGPWR